MEVEEGKFTWDNLSRGLYLVSTQWESSISLTQKAERTEREQRTRQWRKKDM